MVVSVTPWNDIVGAVSKVKEGVAEGVCVCPWTTGVGACVGVGVATGPEGPGTATDPEGPNVSPIDLRYDGTSILFQICDSHLDRYLITLDE